MQLIAKVTVKRTTMDEVMLLGSALRTICISTVPGGTTAWRFGGGLFRGPLAAAGPLVTGVGTDVRLLGWHGIVAQVGGGFGLALIAGLLLPNAPSQPFEAALRVGVAALEAFAEALHRKFGEVACFAVAGFSGASSGRGGVDARSVDLRRRLTDVFGAVGHARVSMPIPSRGRGKQRSVSLPRGPVKAASMAEHVFLTEGVVGARRDVDRVRGQVTVVAASVHGRIGFVAHLRRRGLHRVLVHRSHVGLAMSGWPVLEGIPSGVDGVVRRRDGGTRSREGLSIGAML